MKYNGKEVIELSPEKWDNRPRKLLVWGAVNDGYGIKSLIHEEYIEYCIDAKSNSTNHTIWEAYIDGHMRAWYHAAEIPKDIQKEAKSIFKPCGGVNTPELLK